MFSFLVRVFKIRNLDLTFNWLSKRQNYAHPFIVHPMFLFEVKVNIYLLFFCEPVTIL